MEDTNGDWMIADLRLAGFSERVLAGVDAMTKRPGEDYYAFIMRCSLNEDALDVKLKDLHHNLTLSRNDFTLIQGMVMFIALFYVLVNLGVDLLYAALDPRIRYR